MKSNHQWFKDNLDSDGDGLCEWEGTDSGWDNSPRFDAGPVEALDLACWLYLDAVLLSTMAQRLAQIDDHFAFHDEAAAILQRIQTDFWDAGQGFFFDLEVDTNIRRPVRSPATFLPLFVGAATPEQAAAVALHLNDTNTFSTLFPLPSVAPTDPAYSATNYWRGPVWIILNALTIWGLERYDFDKEADALRTKTLELIESQETTYEYYNSQNGEPLGGQDFMWTAALYILLQGDDPTIW